MADGLARPFSRSKSAGRFGRNQQKQSEPSNQNSEVTDSDLNVRVKERDPTTAGEERPKSRLMSAIFRGADPISSAEQKTSELKETLKRPLSSLFRRSQSQPNRNAAAATQNSQPTSLPPAQQQPPPPRLTPTGRSPIVISEQQQKGIKMMANQQQQQGTAIGRGSAIANGNFPNATASATVSSTATRPFSGFPGRRPPVNTQTELAYGQSVEGEQQQKQTVTTAGSSTFNIDLSEQAAIAPQINLRRLSGISYTSDHNFARRDGGGLQRRNSGKIGGEIDVNFLSRFLCPEDETSDERFPWNWDSLFANVSSELREEWALEEEANNGEMAMAGELGTMPNGLNQQQQSNNNNRSQWQRN